MHAPRLLLAALAGVLLFAVALPVAGHGAKPPRTLKVSPKTGTATTSFRVAFLPWRTATASSGVTYRVRLDWRGGRARTCDRTQIVNLYEVRRARWKALRLQADHPRRRPRWCAGTFVGRIQTVEPVDPCDTDSICRDDAYDEVTTIRRFTVRVRRAGR